MHPGQNERYVQYRQAEFKIRILKESEQLSLFNKLYKKGEKVRLLGVRFSHLVPMTIQMNLFYDAVEKLELFKAVDDIKNQFGSDLLTKASAMKKKK